MPTADPALLTWGARTIRDLKPKRVLDVGIGFGKWGFLAREYAEARAPHAPATVTIDGIEGFGPYVTALQRAIYDDIIVGDARRLTPDADYDLMIFGDMIEHMSIDEGHQMLRRFLLRTRHAMVVTPAGWMPQEHLYGNPFEQHQSVWAVSDFGQFPIASHVQADGVLGVLLVGARNA